MSVLMSNERVKGKIAKNTFFITMYLNSLLLTKTNSSRQSVMARYTSTLMHAPVTTMAQSSVYAITISQAFIKMRRS